MKPKNIPGICRRCYKVVSDYRDLAVILENTPESPISDQEYEDIEIGAEERGIELPEFLELGICYDCIE